MPVRSAVITLRWSGIAPPDARPRVAPGEGTALAPGPAVVPCCPAAMTVTVPRCERRAQACVLALPAWRPHQKSWNVNSAGRPVNYRAARNCVTVGT